MASIPGFRFDITGASGSQGLLSPKSSWRTYIFPRGGYASQDSTGTLITFDSAAVASRFAVNNWLQVGLATANIRQVSSVGGNSISVSGAALTITENNRIFLVGNTQPTVSGGSATYTTPNTLIRQRDDDGSDLYTNSMITSNADGLIQGFGAVNFYDAIIQDGNQSNQGSIVDLEIGSVSGASFEQAVVFGATATFLAGVSANTTVVIGQTLTVLGTITGNTINAVTIRSKINPVHDVTHPDFGAVGDGSTDDTSAIQAAIDAANTAGGGTVILPAKTFKIASASTLSLKPNVRIVGQGPRSVLFKSVSVTAPTITISNIDNAAVENLRIHHSDIITSHGNILIGGTASNVVVQNCILDDGYAGVWIQGGSKIRILNNNINDLERGVYVGHNVAGSGADIESVIISGNDIHSIDLFDGIKTSMLCHNIVITSNSIHDCAADAIDLFVSGDRVVVSDNVLYNNASLGLDIKTDRAGLSISSWGTAREVLVSNNIIRGNSVGGINLQAAALNDYPYNVVCSGNMIVGNAGDGVSTRCPQFIISNNIIHANGTSAADNYFGIDCSASFGNTTHHGVISNNVITNNGNTASTAGINVGASTSVTITGNVFDQIVLPDDPHAGNSQSIGLSLISGSYDVSLSGNFFGSGLATKVQISGASTRFYSAGNVGLADAHGPMQTFAGSDATPSVDGGNFFITGNTVSTTITNFDNGRRGQVIYVVVGDTFTIIDFTGTALRGNSATDWSPALHDYMTGVFSGSTWHFSITEV
jgi:polygalacturonase